MFNIVLFEPEIPPNTGNLIRLCANTGFKLHLIHPLGFQLSEKKLRRAGLDYAEFAELNEYSDYQHFLSQHIEHRIFACTTKGSQNYSKINYQAGDCLVFGPETRGLPDEILESIDAEKRIRIPMRAQSRSINLSNAVAIIAFEAWRQNDFQENF